MDEFFMDETGWIPLHYQDNELNVTIINIINSRTTKLASRIYCGM